jgi:putative transcriptional regulator
LCEEPPSYTPDKVVEIRTSIAKVSQSVFASLLNVSVSTVQKWESPAAEKRPSGAAAKLLQLVESKGIQVLIP